MGSLEDKRQLLISKRRESIMNVLRDGTFHCGCTEAGIRGPWALPAASEKDCGRPLTGKGRCPCL